jgi:hypothetical protein
VELNRLFSSQDSILLDKQQDMIISLLPAGRCNVRARPHACVRVQPGARVLCACRRVCTLCACARTPARVASVAHCFLLCRGRNGLSKGSGWAADVSLASANRDSKTWAARAAAAAPVCALFTACPLRLRQRSNAAERRRAVACDAARVRRRVLGELMLRRSVRVAARRIAYLFMYKLLRGVGRAPFVCLLTACSALH